MVGPCESADRKANPDSLPLTLHCCLAAPDDPTRASVAVMYVLTILGMFVVSW